MVYIDYIMLVFLPPLITSASPAIFHPLVHLSICCSICLAASLVPAMASSIIRPHFAELEKCLDLNPLLGEFFSSGLITASKMEELHKKKNKRKQNRAFLMYLRTQPVKQLKRFCHILLGDVGNASHQELAAEMLVAIPPTDPWKRISSLLHTIANQLSQSPDSCFQSLKQAMDQYQMKFPQQPHKCLADLLVVVEEIDSVTDVTAARSEILQVYQSIDW